MVHQTNDPSYQQIILMLKLKIMCTVLMVRLDKMRNQCIHY